VELAPATFLLTSSPTSHSPQHDPETYPDDENEERQADIRPNNCGRNANEVSERYLKKLGLQVSKEKEGDDHCRPEPTCGSEQHPAHVPEKTSHLPSGQKV